jgi:diguanylate cyclase (GGDEF)-like protein/PAS domain S-box-containing protein
MTDRSELLEAALENLPDGIALLGEECQVVFWNRAAEAMTGHSGAELLSRPVPEGLKPLLMSCPATGDQEADLNPRQGRGFFALARHKLGHELTAISRALVLRDGMGRRIGVAIVFHPAESQDALPHGERSEDTGVQASQTDFEDRLEVMFDDSMHGGVPFGVLWITVDQAHFLRKTHGIGACESMLEKVQRSIAQGLRPGEQLGRWGDNEYLVLSHERTPEMLAAHAQMLAGLARTADFRWWGDRVSITVSIGAAQADQDETLAQLLERAQQAMVASIHAGGNRITPAPGGISCLPS